MTDKQLRQDILDELDFEPSIDAAHIGVAADRGVVTLSGHVSSYSEKLAAETAVERVKGVCAIASEIDVRYPDDKKTADDEIARRAVDILRWSTMVPRDAIQITVRDAGHDDVTDSSVIEAGNLLDGFHLFFLSKRQRRRRARFLFTAISIAALRCNMSYQGAILLRQGKNGPASRQLSCY